MSESERWQQVKQVLHQVLERGPEERAAFLAEACAGEESLRKEVEALLDSYEQAGSFFETPVKEDIAKVLVDDQVESLVGQSLGPYRVISQLGVGGMGEVYLAEDQRLARKVALKLLPTFFTHDEDRMRRFRHEARSASALNHPNILTIHELGTIGGRDFIATEYIEGETLRRRMSRPRMEAGEAIDIAAQVASALSAAHRAGIAHRDIKPENVMIRHDGIVKVLDFGLAKLTEQPAADSRVSTLINTETGVVMGTAMYMSPEQARALPIDARTDIWSLGVILYEMVAGRAPFEGETRTDTIVAVLQTEPPPLSHLAPQVPAELERIVTKALRKDRRIRYQTAADMLVDLKSLKQELEFEAKLGRSAQRVPGRDAAVAQSDERATPATSSAESLVTEIKRHKRGAIIIALATLVILISGFAVYHFLSGTKTTKSLAILPFVNTSGDQELDYLSEGIAESLINNLSHLPNVKVMSRNAVFRYTGKEPDALTVGRELGVETVLTGRVKQRAEDLTISVELVNARDNSHIWGEQYNRKPSDLLAVQLEISRQISEKLRLSLTGQEQQRVIRQYTGNPEAYQLYMKGRYYLERRTEENIKRAVKYFQQATELDPQYALAYAELSNAYSYLGDYEQVSPRENYFNVKAAVLKALEIDDTLGEAHAQLADLLHLYEWDWAGAEREFKRAIELSPNYAEAHHLYSHYLLERGRIAESLAESKWNLELDPLSTATNLHLGWHYLYSRQYDQAIAQELRTLEMDPNYARAYLYLAQAYEQKGMLNEAVEAYLKHKLLDGASPEEIVALKAAYAGTGIAGYWRKALELKLEASKSKHVPPYDIAAHYARLGEKEPALEMLAKAYAEHSPAMVGLNLDFEYDGLRSDARFKDLVRRVGLPN